MDLNQGPQPKVLFDVNGVRYIDPNPTDQIVNHEDLVVYVKLVAKSKGRSILTNTEDETIIIEKELKNVGENTNFTYTEGKNYIDTDWTNIGGGPSPLGTDLGGFGITNINIDFKSSFMPQIIIDFVDVRGASLFEQGPCSPYAMFFHLPYPVFELTVKGYYGKPVTYSLALTKFNTKFNAETGNFESKGEFVGYTYAFLADIPIGYILAANYMEDGPQILAQKWSKIVSKPEFTDSPYGLDPKNPITIFDMIVKAKKLETQLPKLKNTTEVQDVAKLAKARRSLIELKEEILEYAREIGITAKQSRPNGGIRKNDEASSTDPATVYYIRVPKDATESSGVFQINEKNKKYVSTDLTAEGFNAGNIAIQISNTKATFDTIGRSDPPNLVFQNFVDASSGFFGAPIIENSTYPNDDEYYIDISDILKPIDVKIEDINNQYKKKRKTVQEQLNQKVREILEFWPSIRNVFAIILSNTEVFLELMARTSKEAEQYHTNVDIRGGLGGTRNVVDLNQDLGASDGNSENFVYPWPTYYETIQKTVENEGDSGEKETYPGENEEFVAWPEVIFCEDFIQALTKLRRDLEVLDIENFENEPGFDNYAPITAFETPIFDQPKAPNRWFGVDLGIDGLTEVMEGVYNIMGENAFILGDYSMINTLSLWKSQLGFSNGWGWEPLSNSKGATNGFSNTVIDGIGPINQGPQRFVDNPNVINYIDSTDTPGNISNQLGRYAGNGFNAADETNAFPTSPDKVFEGTKNYPESEGRYNFSTKVNPTTKAKMRHWGRIDATNLLQTLGSDEQTEILNIIRQTLNPSGQITAEDLKDRIKETLIKKYGSKFKEETFTDWTNSASAEINNTIANPKLITKQKIWDGQFSYVKSKPVLTLNGPIELNHLETIDGKISSNPWNNPYQGVRLISDEEKKDRSITIKEENVVSTIKDLFDTEYDKVIEDDNLAESTSGDKKTGMSYASLWGKPKGTFDKKGRSPYYRTGGRWSGNVMVSKGVTRNAFIEGEKGKLTVDKNLNMLRMEIKDFRENFFNVYTDAVGLKEDSGVLWDLGSSRAIYTLETEDCENVSNTVVGNTGKMYSDMISAYASNKTGAADAFVQTPLWTLNYPPYKCPILATYTWMASTEVVGIKLDGLRVVSNGDQRTVDGLGNQFRNFATWWGINSYYGAEGNDRDLIEKKYNYPLAYLFVMSLGYDPIQMNDGKSKQKCGHHIPFDGENFIQENSFTNFTNQHIVVETPKSWLLLLGAVLWRAKEGHLLDTSYDNNIEPQYKYKGWNFGNISNNDNDGVNTTDDTSDPVWFFHNSISKPLRRNGCILTINSVDNNEGVSQFYARRYLGFDENGIDRWTGSGGEFNIYGLQTSAGFASYPELPRFGPTAEDANLGTKAGLIIGGNSPVNTNSMAYPTLHSFPYDGGQQQKGWTKSQAWPRYDANKGSGPTLEVARKRFRKVNNINRGLFDQCRQDQMPFVLRTTSGFKAYDGDPYTNIEYPHTLVMADLSPVRDRNPKIMDGDGNTKVVVNEEAKYEYSEIAPSRVPNRYVNLKQSVKELMFLPDTFKRDLIDYFEKWAINEAVGGQTDKDNWLGIYDPLNFDPTDGIFLGDNTPSNGRATWTKWKKWGEPSQFQWGWNGYLGGGRTSNWRSRVMEGNLQDGVKSSAESGGGYFSDKDKKYNLWYQAYGGDSNIERIKDTKATSSSSSSSSSVNTTAGGGSFGKCFTVGHKINTTLKLTKNIEDLVVGDTILTYDKKQKEFTTSTITEFITEYKNEILTIELENGVKIKTDPKHPFNVKDKGPSSFRPKEVELDTVGIIKQLSKGDEIYYNTNGILNYVKIKKLIIKKRTQRVFDFKVENKQNYFVNNVLTTSGYIKQK